ncbi:centaurin/arf [Anaeramoeba flamelloides]|uniref:Centaurin/arf n=1 Tax=Anaeramoeba flamelloides TaxID=1746091 RepID=A0ABQ8YZA8_9EUKA|nr:centaurin/arf [Anaeramoeba flamelloides]
MEINIEEIIENSPSFQKKLHQFEERLEKFKEYLRRIQKIFVQYSKIAKSLSEVGMEVSKELLEFNQIERESQTFDLKIMDSIHSFSRIVEEINRSRKTSFSEIQYLLIDPIDNFINNDLTKAKEARKKYDRLVVERDNAYQKFLNLGVNQELSKYKEFSKECSTLEEKVALANFDLVSQLSLINDKKKFEFVERVCATVMKQLGFFQINSDLMQSFTKQFESLCSYLGDIKINSEKEESFLLTKREKMLKLMNKGTIYSTNKKEQLNKRGYLNHYIGKRGNKWRRDFFIVENHKIHYQKNWQDVGTMGEIDLLYCSVRLNTEIGKRNCFEIYSLKNINGKLILQGKTAEETQLWIDLIEENISCALNSQVTTQTGIEKKNEKIVKEIHSIPGNEICVDCGKPDPVWASINYGVVFCVDCSSFHRSLGAHISKVRSLTLDHWTPELVDMMKKIGNKMANKIMEKKLIYRDKKIKKQQNEQSNETNKSPLKKFKPNPKDGGDLKKKFILQKYQKKKFISIDKKLKDPKALYKRTIKAIKESDFQTLYRCILFGSEITKRSKENYGKNCLSIALEIGDPLIIELLLRNTSEINCLDFTGRTSIHYAIANENIHAVRDLIDRGVFLTKKEIKNYLKNNETFNSSLTIQSPLKIASKVKNYEIIQIINKELPKSKQIYIENKSNSQSKNQSNEIEKENQNQNKNEIDNEKKNKIKNKPKKNAKKGSIDLEITKKKVTKEINTNSSKKKASKKK